MSDELYADFVSILQRILMTEDVADEARALLTKLGEWPIKPSTMTSAECRDWHRKHAGND